MTTRVRKAVVSDAEGVSRILREIIAATGRERASSPDFVIANYIENPDGIMCSLAVDENGDFLGFQSLIQAVANNCFDVPEGWGIIGTHVSPKAHRQGVGRALFEVSKRAASEAGIEKIDAYIGADNHAAQRYYDSLGFQTYREPEGVVQKVFEL